jgi:exopolyphosphatase/guanosine-5'-triphosphate,3'-diphosphate pyrophosphatase
MPHAIIDLGTNTFNLLVFEKEETTPGTPSLKILHSEEVPVFLGKGGLEKGRIADDAFERGTLALQQLAATARSMHAERIHGFGCSTFRNSSNAKDFIRAAAEIGIEVTVIPGDQEAEIILDGVRHAVPLTQRPALVIDIGGGSIEFMLATDKALMWKQSFELGVTRLRERIPVSDQIQIEEEMRIAQHLDAHLEPLWQIIDRHEPHVLIGSAGSFDSLAVMVRSADNSDTGNGRSQFFSADDFQDLKDRLFRLDRQQRSSFPGLPSHRVDTILYAFIAIDRVLVASGIREIACSAYSLKEGAAWRMIRAAAPSLPG